MKRIFSFFFLIIMMLNVILPMVERLRGADTYEWTASGSDDSDEDGKTKKEKEKESFAASHFFHTGNLDAFVSEKVQRTLICQDDPFIAEFYASVPELPPEV